MSACTIRWAAAIILPLKTEMQATHRDLTCSEKTSRYHERLDQGFTLQQTRLQSVFMLKKYLETSEMLGFLLNYARTKSGLPGAQSQNQDHFSIATPPQKEGIPTSNFIFDSGKSKFYLLI
jgi:hypothetical protein